MNHHWLEKQKLWANKARFREVGHQRESSSEYIIRKLELIRLVYNYTDSETIQAIMEEVPDSWASILNPQYLKSIMEFQNAVKYHKETLAKLESPTPPQPQRLPNWEFLNTRFPYWKANVNLSIVLAEHDTVLIQPYSPCEGKIFSLVSYNKTLRKSILLE